MPHKRLSSRKLQSRPSQPAPTKRRAASANARRASSDLPRHVVARLDARDAALLELGFDSYKAFLRSDRWHSTKQRFRESQMPQECICGDDDVHLHHLTYERLGHERLSDLLPLCRACHSMIHTLERRGLIGLDLSGFVMDEERAAEGRAFLMKLVIDARREQEQLVKQRQADVLAMSFAQRLMSARDVAHTRRRDVSHKVHLLGKMISRGRHRQATALLRKIEEAAYDWEGWGDMSPVADQSDQDQAAA